MRRAIYTLVGLVVLLITGYATVPWWLPSEWLRTRIAGDLSVMLGCQVEVGRVALDWTDGVSIDDIDVRDAGTRGGSLVKIRRVGCGLTPLRWLSGQGLDRLELTEPNVFVQIANNGRLNLAALTPQVGGPATTQWVVRSAVIHLLHESQPVEPAIRIGGFRMTVDPDTGATSLSLLDGSFLRDSTASQPSARWNGDAKLVIPTARSRPPAASRPVADSPMQGDVAFRWDRLDLSSIPLGWSRALLGTTLAGACSGSLTATVHQDLQQSFDLRVSASDLQFSFRSGDPLAAGSVVLRARGRWDPTDDKLTLEDFGIELPGVALAARRPAQTGQPESRAPLVFAPRGETPLILSSDIRVVDWKQCSQWCPVALRDVFGRLAGGANVQLDLIRHRDVDDFDIRCSGENFAVDGSPHLVVRPFQHVAFEARGHLDRKNATCAVASLGGSVGGVSWQFAGTIPAPRDSPPAASQAMQDNVTRWRREARAKGSLSVADMRELLSLFPAVRDQIVARAGDRGFDAAGPMTASLGISPDGETQLDVAIAFAESSQLRVGSWFDKPSGRPMQAEMKCHDIAEDSYAFIANATASIGGQALAAIGAGPAVTTLTMFLADERPGARSLDEFLAHVESVATKTKVEFAQIEEWRSHSPALDSMMRDSFPGTVVAGSVTAGVDAQVSVTRVNGRSVAREVHAAGRLDLLETSVDSNGGFAKPRGKPANIEFDLSTNMTGDVAAHRGEATVTLDGATARASASVKAGATTWNASINVTDAARLAAHELRWAQRVRKAGLSGQAMVALSGSIDVNGTTVDVTVNAGQLAWATSNLVDGNGAIFSKRAGTPLLAHCSIDWPTPNGPRRFPSHIHVKSAALASGQSWASVEDGRAQFTDHPADASPGVQPVGPALQLGRIIQSLDLRGRVRVDCVDARSNCGPAVVQFLDRNAMHGAADVEWSISMDGHSLRQRTSIAADSLALDVPGILRIASGAKTRLAWDAALKPVDQDWHAWLNSPPGSPRRVNLRLESLTLDAMGTSAEAHADVHGFSLDGRTTLDSAHVSLDAALRVDDLKQLASCISDPPIDWIGGGLRARVAIRPQAVGSRLDELRLRFDDVRMRPANADDGSELRLNGPLWLSPAMVQSDGMMLRLGASDVTWAGKLTGRDGDLTTGIVGRFAASSEEADLDQLPREIELWQAAIAGWAARHGWTVAAPTSAPAAPMTQIPAELLTFLRNCSVTSEVHCRHAHIPHLSSAGPFFPDELVLEPSITDQTARLPFRCAVSGGIVTGGVSMTLVDPNPYFDLWYDAHRLASEKNVRPIVENFFTGLTVDGFITLIDATHQRMFDVPGVPNPAVGSGTMLLERGTVMGRAAPLAITAIFPGLNTAKMDFSRLENRFNKGTDGRMDNDMVFFGPLYNMYVDGSNLPDGRIRYEIGVDLLADVAPSVSRGKQGRVALFIKTARKGPNATLLDETVSYLRPDQILAKILSDNPLTQAYTALKARIKSSSRDHDSARP